MARFAIIYLFMVIFSGAALVAGAGTMDYNTTAKRYEFYDGTHWRQFQTGIGVLACTKEGAMDFDHLLSYYRFCNGAVWVPITGALTLSPCSAHGEMNYIGSSYYYCNGLLWVNMGGSIVS